MTPHAPGAPLKYTRQESEENTSDHDDKPDISKDVTGIRRRRLAFLRALKLAANLQARIDELVAENAQLEHIIHAQAQRLEQLQNASRLTSPPP